jgi:hypothetical protein
MRARDELERVVVSEGFCDVAAEKEAGAARGEAPTLDV